MPNAILLISCKDKKGITAAVSNFVYKYGGNIEHADQHIDKEANTFFMRIEWSLEEFKIPKNEVAVHFSEIAEEFKMRWDLYFTDETSRMAIFVSKHVHCLYDLLLRHKSGQLRCKIPLIISNHPDAKDIAHNFGIDYFEFPISKENKDEQEKRQIELMEEGKIDVIVLARYGQIFSGEQLQHRVPESSYQRAFLQRHDEFFSLGQA
jgi:formyltetrahydrofolate deformylase